MLPDAVWQSRHRAVVTLLAAHVVLLPAYAVWRGNTVGHALSETLPVILALLTTLYAGFGRGVRASAAALGLMTCSGVLVHLSEGMIEAHFHFFVMIPVVAMYEAWPPFALGVGYVLVHHGVMGTLDPRSVYNHPQAWDDPWLFAGIHAALFASACAACLVNWWLHERSRLAQSELLSSLAHSAEHDPLTGLPNRTAFLRLGSVEADEVPTAVLVVDIDGFVQVNDTLGHTAGDHLVEQVAQRIAERVRADELLCRLGGDEFAVLLRGTTLEDAMTEATAFLALFDTDFVVDDTLLRVDAHVGVALGNGAGTDLVPTLLRRADVAMRQAKRAGSRVVVYDPATDHHTRERLALLAELRRGLERDELVLHYQPKLSLEDGRVVGVEALVRWQHPERGLLSPGVFVPFAEQTALISGLTRWVLDAALAQARVWADEGRDLPVAVNVSPRCLLEHDFAEWVVDAVERWGLPGRSLRLEILESTFISSPERALDTLNELHAAGVRLSIDDFGTGYSSMSHLRHLPIDELKIDRHFIAGMIDQREDAILVQTAIELGHNLGLTVVGEGVETTEAIGALRAAGCDVVQGFHIAPPLQPDDLLAWLAREETSPAQAS